jgi:hypothetical protein
MKEGYPMGLMGQSDANRVFHPLLVTISTNETEETGLKVFQALQELLPPFDPLAYMGDGAFPYRNAFARVYGSQEEDKEQTMCFVHVYKVFVMNQFNNDIFMKYIYLLFSIIIIHSFILYSGLRKL